MTWMAWRITTWWKRCYEGLRGARFVSPLSHIILRFFTGRGGLVVCVLLRVWVALFAFVCFSGFSSENSASN